MEVAIAGLESSWAMSVIVLLVPSFSCMSRGTGVACFCLCGIWIDSWVCGCVCVIIGVGFWLVWDMGLIWVSWVWHMVELIFSEVVSRFSFIFVLSVGVIVEVVVCCFVMCVVLRVRFQSLLHSATQSFALSDRVTVVVL